MESEGKEGRESVRKGRGVVEGKAGKGGEGKLKIKGRKRRTSTA